MDEQDTPVVWIMHDGRLQIMDCEVCPWRGKLCDQCVVPGLLAVDLTDAGQALQP
jgi:hypothetical protein